MMLTLNIEKMIGQIILIVIKGSLLFLNGYPMPGSGIDILTPQLAS